MTYLLFDLVALAIIVCCAAIGYSRGFIKTFFGLFGFVIAIVLALLLAAPLAEFLREKLIEPALSSLFLDKLSKETMQSPAEVDFSALPAGALALFSRFGISPEALANRILEAGTNMGQELARSLAEAAVSRAAVTLSHAVAFISVFVLSSVVIKILTRVLDLVAKVPGLHFSNRVFGLLAGIGEGLALAYVYAHVLALLQPTMQGSDIAWLNHFSVESTYLVRFLSGVRPGAS